MSQPPTYPPTPGPNDPKDPSDRLQFDTFEPADGAEGTASRQPPDAPPAEEHPPLPSGPQMEVDPQRLQAFIDELRWRQSLPLAVLAGAAAAALSAVGWAMLTAATKHTYGIVAIGVGLLVGFAVRTFGKGIDRRFSVVGAAFSLLGCFVGNLLAVCIMASRELGIPLKEILLNLTPGLIVDITKDTFEPWDAVFYAIAVYEGYRFSTRPIRQEEVAALTRPVAPR